jgi:hypothetical protein
MAKTIPQLTDATTVNAADELIIQQGGITKRATGAELAKGLNAINGTVNVKDFGAVGDGVADDSTAIQAAANAANTAGKPLYMPKGTYRLVSAVTFYKGVIGDGVGQTVLQAVNNNAQANQIVTISGAGNYENFTVDGAVSADPVTWNSGNYNSFTGWKGIAVAANNVVLQNVMSQNCRWGAFSGFAVTNVTMINCRANRCRGDAGDGFFFYSDCHRITHINCSVTDYTRIGFVFEGDFNVSLPSSNCTYINCFAENGHDASSNYGGGGFSSGFWSENCREVTWSACKAINSGERGYTALSGSGGLSAAPSFHFAGCLAENNSPSATATILVGFISGSLGNTYRAKISASACVTKLCNSGFSATTNGDLYLTNCSYMHDGGTDQARAISAETGASVFVDDFFQHWVNRPAAYLSTSLDAASIGSFSGAVTAPVLFSIKNFRTHDGSSAIIKQAIVDATFATRLHVCDSAVTIASFALFANGAKFENCAIGTLASSSINVKAGDVLFENCTIAIDNNSLLLGWNEDTRQIVFSNCSIAKTGTGAILLYRVGSAGTARSALRFVNTAFVGDLTAHDSYVIQNAEAGASSLAGQDLFFSGCTFYNTGSATNNELVEINATSLSASKAFFTGCWKSSTISTPVKAGGFLAAQSSIADLTAASLTGSATYDPSNLIDGAGETTTVTVTGAALGDYAEASFSLDLQGITVTAWVSAANTVSVRFQNETGGTIDLGSGTLRARVFKP